MGMERKRVVITGMGMLSSAGIGQKETWRTLVQGNAARPTLLNAMQGAELWESFYVHALPSFDINSFGIEPAILDAIRQWKEGETVTDLEYLMAAGKLALDDSGLSYDPDSNRIGCVLTHENPGLEQYCEKLTELAYDKLTQGAVGRVDFAQYLHDKSIKSAYEMQTFTVQFHVMKALHLHGYSLFCNNACASGLHALENARMIIDAGHCPAVLVAAADYPRIYKYLWFKQLGMYSHDGVMRPFDKNGQGLVFGDGGAAFVLEEYEHAVKRGATMYAEYLGGGFTQEAWKTIFPQVGSSFYQDAIGDALQRSGCLKGDIDALCAHGASHPVIDRYEAAAIESIFGPAASQPLVTALKPLVGHNLGGNTLLETAILLQCMQHDTLLPVVNTTEIHPRVNLNIVRHVQHRVLTTVMKICCAFAGYNAAAVFRRPS